MPRYIMHNDSPNTGRIEQIEWGIIAHIDFRGGDHDAVSIMLNQATAAADLLSVCEAIYTHNMKHGNGDSIHNAVLKTAIDQAKGI